MIVFQQIVRSKELINLDYHKLAPLQKEAQYVHSMHLSKKQKHSDFHTETQIHFIHPRQRKEKKLALPAVVGPDLFVVSLALDCHEDHSDKEDAGNGAQGDNENQGQVHRAH